MENKSDRKPIQFRQLCALLRSIIDADPGIDYAEWKERALERLLRLGFETPSTVAAIDTFHQAMAAVEHAFCKTHGPRPVALPSLPTEAPRASVGPPPSASEANARLQDLQRELEARGLPARGLDRILAPARDPTNRTLEQIAAWRQGTGRTPTHRPTKHGWEPIADPIADPIGKDK